MGGNGIPVVAHRASRLSALVMIVSVALALLPSAALAKSRTAEAIGAPTDDQAVGYQINPAHDGVQADATLFPPLVSKWGIRFRNEYVSYPLIAGNRVFVIVWNVPASGAVLWGFDLDTGTLLWPPVELGTSSQVANAAYEGGHVFVIGGEGEAWAVDAASGRTVWFTHLEGQRQFDAAPTAMNGIIYTSGYGVGGTVYAINESDGSIRWRAPVNNGDQPALAVSSGAVYVSSACDETAAFDPLTGAALWHYATSCKSGNGMTPVLHAGRLYVRDPALPNNVVLDAATGQPVGNFVSQSAPTFDASNAIVMPSRTVIEARDIATGALAWSFTGDKSALLPPIAVNGYVYTASRAGTLFAIDASNGTVAWSGPAGTAESFPEGKTLLYGLSAGDGAIAVPVASSLQIFGTTPASGNPGPDPLVTPALPPLQVGSSIGQQVSFQVDANHAGVQLDDATVPPLTRRWIAGVGAASHPLIINGRAYLANGGLMDCPLVGTGCRGTNIGASGLSYDAGRIFAVDVGGTVRAVDPATDTVLWSRSLPGQPWFGGDPGAHHGMVYVARPGGSSGSGGTLYALSEADGTVAWSAPVTNGLRSEPVVTDTGVYVAYSCAQVYDFNPSDGSLIWHHAGLCQGDTGRTPALYRGRLYVRDPSSGNLIFDAATGEIVGSFSATVAPAFYGSLAIYLNGNTLRAVDLDTGFLAWTYRAESGAPPDQPFDSMITPPLIDNGYVYVGGAQSTLIAVDVRTGQPVWWEGDGFKTFQPPAEDDPSAPLSGFAAGEGYVLAQREDTLYAYSMAPPAAPTLPRKGGAMAPDEVTAYQVDPAHDGSQGADTLTPPLARTLSVDFPGHLSYPLIVNGKAWFSVSNEPRAGTTLYVIDIKTGKPAWLPYSLLPSGGMEEQLTYEAGKVFVLGQGGLMLAFDAGTGREVWRSNLRNFKTVNGVAGQSWFANPPTALNGIIYTIGTGSGASLYAIRETDGSLLWSSDAMNNYGAVAVTSTGVYDVSPCTAATDHDPQTGAVIWSSVPAGCPTGSAATPIVYGGKLYVRSTDSTNNTVFDAQTGARLGPFPGTAPPAFAGSLGYFLSSSTLEARDLATDAAIWSFSGDGNLNTAPIVDNGTVYIGSSTGNLYALDALSGALTWSTATGVGFLAPEDVPSQTYQVTGLAAAQASLVAPSKNRLSIFAPEVNPTPTPTPTATPTPTPTPTSTATPTPTPTPAPTPTPTPTSPGARPAWSAWSSQGGVLASAPASCSWAQAGSIRSSPAATARSGTTGATPVSGTGNRWAASPRRRPALSVRAAARWMSLSAAAITRSGEWPIAMAAGVHGSASAASSRASRRSR